MVASKIIPESEPINGKHYILYIYIFSIVAVMLISCLNGHKSNYLIINTSKYLTQLYLLVPVYKKGGRPFFESGHGKPMKAAVRRRRRACELCGGAAAVHCEADAAHLCWPCDAHVHGANFLVARHLRRVACTGCGALDDDRLLAGAGSPAPIRSVCGSCGGGAAAAARGAVVVADEESDTESCVSTAESATAGRRRARGGGPVGARERVRLAAVAVWGDAKRRRKGEIVLAPRRLEEATGGLAEVMARDGAMAVLEG